MADVLESGAMPSLWYYLLLAPALLLAITCHECAHAAVARLCGDATAQEHGRLTLNPLAHIDLFGTIVLPVVLALMHLPPFGWAKPVPYNPYNLKNPKTGTGLIAAAGPFSNLVVALIFGILIRILGATRVGDFGILPLLLHTVVFINVLLAIFNLFPLPPLDGSKVLFAFLPDEYDRVRLWLERYGFVLLLLFIFYGFDLIRPIIGFVYELFVGGGGLL